MLSRLQFSLVVACLLLLSASVSVSAQTPFFSLTFTTDPRAAANLSDTAAGYGWEQYDQSDVACGISQYHQGLISLAGGPPDTPATVPPTVDTYGAPQYLNLSASSGPYTVGTVLPVIFGPSTGGSWSVEVTFKPGIQEQWGKIIDIGSTRTNSNCNNDFYLGWQQDSQTMATGMCDSTGASNGNNDFAGTWVAGQWYHTVIVVQQLGDGATLGNGQGNWTLYRNGVQQAVLSNTSYPLAAERQNAMIGNSNWGDFLWSGLIDTFNVYDVALSADEVATLSSVALGGTSPTLACTTPSIAITVPASAVYYSNTFSSDPITALSLSSATYEWVPSDPTDTGELLVLHQGLLLLNGSNPVGGFANMTATSGVSAVASYPLGPVGGLGTGSISDGTLGWSFEVLYKPFAIDNFAKVYDITNGEGLGGIDDILYGYNSNTGAYEVDYVPGVYAANGVVQQTIGAAGPSSTTFQADTWYHHVWVIQYNSTASTDAAQATGATTDLAQYYSYLNGTLFGSLTNAIYPPFLTRANGFLGRSAWNDSAWQGYVDLFRVYSVALTAGQVQTLYEEAMVTGLPSAPPASSSSSASAALSSSSAPAASSSSAPAASSSSSAAAAVTAGASSSSSAPAASSSSSAAAATAGSSSASSASAASSSSSVAAATTGASSSSSAAVSSSTGVSQSSSSGCRLQ